MAQNFEYQSPEADVNALRNLLNAIKRESQPERWGDDMNERFLFDLVRRPIEKSS